jgi:DNA helicase HerA-like ATPase
VARYSVQPQMSAGPGRPILFGGSGATTGDSVVIGRLAEQGPLHSVVFDVSTENVVAVFGKRGSGKSYTLGVLVEGLCTQATSTDIAASTHRRAALLLDTLNVFWSTENPYDPAVDADRFGNELAALETWRLRPCPLNVVVWVPRGYRRAHTPEDYRDFAIAPADLTADDMADLMDIDAQRDILGQLLSEVREKTEAAGVVNFQSMLKVLETDEELAEYYAEMSRRALRQRLRALASQPLFSAAGGVTLRELLKGGWLSVIELGELPNTLRTVLSSVLLRRIHAQRAEASDAEKQLALNTRLTEVERSRLEQFIASAIPPSWVLVDEAQNILPSAREVKSTDAVVRFVREGRNFGLSFALTTQQPSAVDQRILAQADTVICHRLTVAQDIARMRENLKCAEPRDVKLGGTPLDLSAWLRSLEPGVAIISNADADRVFAVEVRPRISPHGGTGYVAPVR